MEKTRTLRAISPRLAAAAALVLASALTAAAQNSDQHLTCYKIKDPLSVKATADLDTATLGMNSDCTITKAALLCAPSDLHGLVTDLPVLSLSGPRSVGQQICYKLKCPAPYPVSEEVTDGFGTRTLTKFKISLVCAPASAGAVQSHSGFDHYSRGLAQLSETTTADGPTLHVQSLDGLDPLTPDAVKSSSSDPGGSGVVVVLQNVSDFGVRVRSHRDSLVAIRSPSLRVGAALRLRAHSRQQSESMAEAVSVAAGASGVASTAYFPRLQRQAVAPSRSGAITCAGAPVGTATETVPGDPAWSWFSPVWPDRYTTASAATTDSATFVWENGCVSITAPDGSGTVYIGDRLVISADNGSSPKQIKRMEITGSGGLAAFALKDEVSH